MFRKFVYSFILLALAVVFASAQTEQKNSDTVMILPFENSSNRAEFNWVGETFANSLSELLKVPGLNVVSNQERKLIQQRLNVPLTVLPSTATSLKIAREANATLLISGKYSIIPSKDDVAAAITVTAKIIRVNEGRFLSEEFPDGRRITRDINLTDALQNLQTIHGQVAYQILYQRDKALAFSQNTFIDTANKVPSRAFEAYVKGLLSSVNLETREIYFKNALRIYAEEKNGEVYPEAALELGHLYLNQSKENDAIDYFSRVPAGTSQYAEAAFYTGLMQWEKKNYEQALAVLRPLADDLKLTSVYNTVGAIAVEASRREKDKGKADEILSEGLEFLKKAAESAPDELNTQFNYGFGLFVNNKYKESVPELLSVVGKRQTDGESYFLLAKAFENLGDKEKSADANEKAIKFLTGNNKYAKLQVEWEKSAKTGGIDLRIDKPSRKDFVSVLQINKKSSPIRNALNETDSLLAQADKYYADGNDDEALIALRKVLVGEPMSAKAYLLLGKIHLRRGDLEQATSSLKTALFWDNRMIDAHIALGKIYLEKDDCLQAKNYSASASLIDAENQEVVALQRQVERCSK